MKIETRHMGAGLLLLLGTLGALSVQAAEGQSYIMLVYADSEHGDSILEGELDETISKLQRRDGEVRDFAEQVSLCVALTRTRQFEQAAEYCDMAITQSDREARRLGSNDGFRRYSKRVAARSKAIAFTNRGVLHALAGEPEEARELFEMAQETDLMEEYARNNLSRLESSMDEDDS